MIELREVNKNDELIVVPLDDNMTKFHFTFEGPKDSIYEKGIYHGTLFISKDYPMTPIDFSFETKNGRFRTNEKVCTTFTQYHPESWNPCWTLEALLIGLRSFFEEESDHEGSVRATEKSRIELAE
ncbi:MAG: hypothetical protein MHPSP_003168, partial [Paramarteilia canceri]